MFYFVISSKKTSNVNNPAKTYFFKAIHENTRAMCKIYSKLIIKTPEQHQVEKETS